MRDGWLAGRSGAARGTRQARAARLRVAVTTGRMGHPVGAGRLGPGAPHQRSPIRRLRSEGLLDLSHLRGLPTPRGG